MATKSSTQELPSLVINKVASDAVYQDMVANNQVNSNELYLIEGDETVTYSLSQSGGTVTLTGSDSSTSSVTVEAAGMAASAVSEHNASTSAHSDIRNAIPTSTSQLTNDSGFITTSDIPEGAAASTTTPLMDGTAAVGTELAFARGNHVHPTDTSRAPTDHASSATTYGTGSSSIYGHVKLSDSTSSTSGVSGGTAATPAAVKAVQDAIPTALSDLTNDEGFTTNTGTVTSIATGNGLTGGPITTTGTISVSYGTTTPNMDGIGAVGTATTVSRSDHTHPTDTSRASASDLTSHTEDTSNPHSVTAAQVGAVPTSRTVNGKALSSDITLSASDVGALPDSTAIPSATSDLTNDSDFVSDASYVHTDNNFTAALKTKLEGIAEGATVDDQTWNGVALDKTGTIYSDSAYLAARSSTSATTAYQLLATTTPAAQKIALYNSASQLTSTTPASGDSSTLVATTAFVADAISALGSVLNYKGTKTTEGALPSSGNETGDVWIVTADSSEYIWNGSAWEKLGPTIDLSGYVPTTRMVNGKALSADIILTASDVGALGEDTSIPSATSDLTNDSGFITSAGAPVQSVNSKTGAVTLTYSDVGAAASSHGTHVTYSTTAPVMDGTASAGSASTVARSDHVHPTDTSRAAASELTNHIGDTDNPHEVTYAQVGADAAGAAAAVQDNLNDHEADATAHVTAAERTAWDAKQDALTGSCVSPRSDFSGALPLMSSVALTTVNGVDGFLLTFYDSDNDLEHSYFVADGGGLNTVLTQVNTAIAAKQDAVSSTDISIATSAWVTNTDSDSSSAGFSYMATVSVSAATASNYADVTLAPTSLSVAKAAGMAPVNDTADGTVTFYAVSIPSAAITATVHII